MFTLYNAVSADGFIARLDGSEDFIPDELWYRFLDICKEYGSFVMGRKTYDTIQAYDQKHINDLEALPIKKIVISTDKGLKLKPGYTLVSSPEEAAQLVPDGLVASGPTLNDYLIQHHMVKKIIQIEVPISIGEGIKPFRVNIDATEIQILK